MATYIPPFFIVHSLVQVAPVVANQRKVAGYQGRVVALAPGVVVVKRVDNGIQEIEPTALISAVG